MPSISSLKLHNFRCYDAACVEDLKPGLIALYGPNGAGKTNVLEAISLLAPGRGLRGARATEIQKLDAAQGWAVSAAIETGSGPPIQIGTGIDPKTEKRIVRINGVTAKGQNALSDYFACVWLTPQMDRLFMDAAGERRRFLDRLIFAFDPGHAGRVTRYENALRQRARLLTEGKGDPSWLSGLEAQMAETGCAIAAARLDFIERLQTACDRADAAAGFPHARLALNGSIEELLTRVTALEVESLFVQQLAQSRARDAQTGGAASGPHKSDLMVFYTEKDMPADQCSTGEQKALLTGIILAHARLIAAERGAPPVLLLDEIAAHLDENRRAALYDILQALGGQVWLTGTDFNLFETIAKTARMQEVRDAKIAAC